MSDRPRWILGISSSHNGAACLLKNDEIAVAIQEERLVRFKRAAHYGRPSSLAVQYCLETAGIRPSDLDAVVSSTTRPMHDRLQDVGLNPLLQIHKHGTPLFRIPHHLSHAVAVFATSGFATASVLVADGSGSVWQDLSQDERKACINKRVSNLCEPSRAIPREIISIYRASGRELIPVEKHLTTLPLGNKRGMQLFGSLGDMYGVVGKQLFGSFFDGAGKVMGLAPYGQATIPASEFFEIVDGSFEFKTTVPERYSHDDRWPLHQEEYSNLAASVQHALEEALLYLASRARAITGVDKLCYAGGVALNSVANEKIVSSNIFRDVYIMPAAEDSGSAIGAAYYGLWKLTGANTRRRLTVDSVGKAYGSEEIQTAIDRYPYVKATYERDIVDRIVTALIDGKTVGWFQGRSELGPRALGQRSILCDARHPHMKDLVNKKIKMRESFRPFAPVVLREHVVEWFDVAPSLADSPFMLRVMRFRPERASRVPAVVHVDGTGRVQTVTPTLNPLLYRLIYEYWRRTGVPLLLNTSFNVAGEPIVETPDDALKCLISTDLDICALGDWFVEKTADRHALLECQVNVAITVAKVRRPLYTPPESDNSLAIRAFSAAADSPMLEYEIHHRFTGPVTEANIATRWGTVTHAIAGDWGDALTLLAAGHTGNDILNKIGRGDRGPSKEDLLALLQILLRLDLISFVTADKTINTSASVCPEDSLLDIYDKARGHEHPSPVTVLKDYLALLRKMGRENEADEIEASRGAI